MEDKPQSTLQDITDLQSLVNIIKILLTSVNKEAESKILKLDKENIVSVAKLIFQTLDPKNNFEKNLIIFAIVTLNNSIKKHIQLKSINESQKVELIKMFLEYLKLPNVDEKIIENLSKGFRDLLDSTDKQPNILTDLTKYLLQINLNELPFDSFFGYIKIIYNISHCNGITKQNFIVVYKFLADISKSFLEIIINVLNSPIPNINIYIKINIIIDTIFKMFLLLVKQLKKKFKKYIPDENKNEIMSLFNFSIPIGVQLLFKNNIVIDNQNLAIDQNSIISWTLNKELDTSVNNMKSKVIRFISIYFLKTNIEINDEYIELFNRLYKNLNYLIISKMENLIHMKVVEKTDDKTPDLEKDYSYSLLISSIMFSIKCLYSKPELRPHLEKYSKDLIKNIIFPFLVINNEEIELCSSNVDSSNYQQITEDITSKHEDFTIKSKAADILCSLLKNNKNIKKFTYDYTLILYIQSLNLENTGIINEVMSPNDTINLILHTEGDKVKKIDLAFLVFCILSNIEINNDDDEEIVESTFKIKKVFECSINLLVLNKLPIYLQYKFILFLKNYIARFYEEVEQKLMLIIKYSFEVFLKSEDYIILEEISDLILNILIDYNRTDVDDENNFINIILGNYMNQIIAGINTSKFPGFFDVLMKIKNIIKESPYDDQIFVAVCKRIQMETERKTRLKFKVIKDKSGKKVEDPYYNYDSSILINKCFNILLTMTKQESFVQKNIDKITQSLTPLFSFVKMIKRIEFDEELLMLITSVIKHLKQIPDSFFGIIQYLNAYVEKNKGILYDLYCLLNCFLVYGNKQIENSEIYLSEIKKIYNTCIIETRYLKNSYYICTLLHIWIRNSPSIPLETVRFFVNSAIDKVNFYVDKIYSDTETAYKYNYLGFLNMIYSSLIHYPQIYFEEIQKLSYSDDIILKWTLPNTKLDFNIYITYDYKVIIHCLSIIMNSDKFKNHFKNILLIACNILNSQKEYEKEKFNKEIDVDDDFVNEEEDDESSEGNKVINKNKSKKKKDKEEKEDDQESNEEEDSEDKPKIADYDDNTEIIVLIKKTIDPLKDEDEFRFFKNALENLRMSNLELVTNVENNLTPEQMNFVREILSLIRVEIIDGSKKYFVPRKIVRPKRNKDNKGEK